MKSKREADGSSGTPEPTRTGLSAGTLERAVLDNLVYLLARPPAVATLSRDFEN